VPTAPPQNVAIQSSTATQLDVTWDPPPVEAQNGDIQGYKVRHFSVLQKFKDQLKSKTVVLLVPPYGVKS